MHDTEMMAVRANLDAAGFAKSGGQVVGLSKSILRRV